jgi:hypothetical protein
LQLSAVWLIVEVPSLKRQNECHCFKNMARDFALRVISRHRASSSEAAYQSPDSNRDVPALAVSSFSKIIGRGVGFSVTSWPEKLSLRRSLTAKSAPFRAVRLIVRRPKAEGMSGANSLLKRERWERKF